MEKLYTLYSESRHFTCIDINMRSIKIGLINQVTSLYIPRVMLTNTLKTCTFKNEVHVNAEYTLDRIFCISPSVTWGRGILAIGKYY